MNKWSRANTPVPTLLTNLQIFRKEKIFFQVRKEYIKKTQKLEKERKRQLNFKDNEMEKLQEVISSYLYTEFTNY